MTSKKPVLSVIVIGILGVLLLSIVAYPFGFMVNAQVNAQTDNVDQGPLSNLGSNDSALNDPLSDAVLTLSDGTNVLSTDSGTDPSTGTDNGATNAGSDPSSTDPSSTDPSSTDPSSTDPSSTDPSSSDSSSIRTTPLELDADAPTGEVGTATGEVGTATGEVGTATGEVTDDSPTIEVVPSDDTTSSEVPEPTVGNTSATDEATGSVESSAQGEPSVESIPSDEAETSIGGGPQTTDQSSASSLDTNAGINDNSGLSSDSVSAASAENPNAVVQPISAGDGQTVSLGDPSSTSTPAQGSFDKESYAPGDTAVLTVTHPAANVDPNFENTISLIVGGTPMTATEDGPNSGIFTVSFTVPAGDSISVQYDSSRPQAQLVINGVTQGGSVEVRELPVSSFQSSLGQGQPDILVGNAIQVSATDDVQLASNSVCDENGLPPPCGGSSTVSLSYANAPLNGQQPASFTIWQFVPGVGWVDLRDFQGAGNIIVDENTMTVTALTPLGVDDSVFVIGVNVGGGGGGGGGAGFPGAGLVLDLVAPIVAAESPPASSEQPSSTESTATTDIELSTIENTEGDDNTNTTSSARSVESVKSGGGGTGEQADISTISRNRNITIAVPGEGNVTLSFTNLISEDDALAITTLKDSDLPKFSITKDATQRGIVKTLDNTPFSLVGSVFVIGPEDVQFNGTITVSVPFKPSLVSGGSDVRLLHYTGSGWEDVTTTEDDLNMVSGSLGSLGVVAPAVKSQSISLVSGAPQ